MAKIAEMIATEELVGEGKQGNPFRYVSKLWSKDGNLIAEYDPATDESRFSPSGLAHRPTLRATEAGDEPTYGVGAAMSRY